MSGQRIESEVINAERRATRIADGASQIQMSALSSTDEQSTITANVKGKRAYTFSQGNSANVSEALTTASGNIAATAISFDSQDRAF